MNFRVSFIEWAYYEAIVDAKDIDQAEERAITRHDDRKFTPYYFDVQIVNVVPVE